MCPGASGPWQAGPWRVHEVSHARAAQYGAGRRVSRTHLRERRTHLGPGTRTGGTGNREQRRPRGNPICAQGWRCPVGRRLAPHAPRQRWLMQTPLQVACEVGADGEGTGPDTGERAPAPAQMKPRTLNPRVRGAPFPVEAACPPASEENSLFCANPVRTLQVLGGLEAGPHPIQVPAPHLR